ncbi:unnamed protein product [Paramecium octaurelia]|uniref:Uncharacterized protein n=1 Tax=Paramecium octaurelia TaxID=43137 RepID=A0A8S1SUI9_PAROT|nr:unnamed protein product [Paramecium octaurelia]
MTMMVKFVPVLEFIPNYYFQLADRTQQTLKNFGIVQKFYQKRLICHLLISKVIHKYFVFQHDEKNCIEQLT